MNIASFHFDNLMPSNEVFELKHSGGPSIDFPYINSQLDYYIRHGEGKQSVRKIFSKVKYEDFELEGIQELKQMAINEHLILPS